MQDLELQLQALEELRSYVANFAAQLSDQISAYRGHIGSLTSTGVSIQVAGTYEASFAEPNINRINAIITQINEADIPYLSRQIEALQDVIERSRYNG